MVLIFVDVSVVLDVLSNYRLNSWFRQYDILFRCFSVEQFNLCGGRYSCKKSCAAHEPSRVGKQYNSE